MVSEPKIEIVGREISRNQLSYMIAELSAHHTGKLEPGLKNIDELVKAGAHPVKLKMYHPETITLDNTITSLVIGASIIENT